MLSLAAAWNNAIGEGVVDPERNTITQVTTVQTRRTKNSTATPTTHGKIV